MAACSAAGAMLNLKDKTAASYGQKSVGYDPPFCYVENGRLKFNVGGKNTGSCSNSDNCLCYTQAKPTVKPTKPKPTKPKPTKPMKKAVLLKKGKCAKGTWITSMAACSAAGAMLKLKDKTAASDGQKSVGYDPPFCYFESGQLKFNVGGKNTGSCSNSDNCLCYTQAKPTVKPTKPKPTKPKPTKPMKKAVLLKKGKCAKG